MKYLSSIFIFALLLSVASANEYSIQSSSEYVPTLSNRLSLSAGINPNPRQMTSLNTLSASYAKKQSVYWFDFIFQNSTGIFQKMTMNNTAATQLPDNQLFDSSSSHTVLGAGLMLDTKYSSILFDSENWYETSSAYLTYNIFKNNSISKSFTGPGLSTKFTTCRKFTDLFSLGANINYLLASVKRSSVSAAETSSSQSLTISYLTIGFEFILTI